MKLEKFVNIERKKERWGNALLARFKRHMKNKEIIWHRACNCGGTMKERLHYAAMTLDDERKRFTPQKGLQIIPSSTASLLAGQ